MSGTPSSDDRVLFFVEECSDINISERGCIFNATFSNILVFHVYPHGNFILLMAVMAAASAQVFAWFHRLPLLGRYLALNESSRIQSRFKSLHCATVSHRPPPRKLTCPLKNSAWKTSLSFSNGTYLGDMCSFQGKDL